MRNDIRVEWALAGKKERKKKTLKQTEENVIVENENEKEKMFCKKPKKCQKLSGKKE